jgi:outer membrane protein insertion porin family
VKRKAPQAIHDEVGYKFYDIIGTKLNYDRRDSQFDTRSGYFVTLDTSLAFPGVGSAVSNLSNVKYVSGTLQGGYFYPVTSEVTVSATSEVGYIQPLFGDYLHYPDGFFLGGPDSLRGFDVHGVGPREANSRKKYGSIGGQFLWDGTVQASFPLGLPEEYQIRGRVFSDFGLLTGTDTKHNVKINDDGSIRASAGFGLTWVSPFGPLAVDLAYPVVRKSEDQIQYFSFSFGTNF